MEAGRVWYDLRASFNSLCSGMNSLLPGHRVLLCCQKWVHWRWVGGAARRASSITFPPRRTPDGKRKTVSSLQQNTFTFWAWLQYFSSFPGMSLWLKASSLIPRGMTSCQQPHSQRNDILPAASFPEEWHLASSLIATLFWGMTACEWGHAAAAVPQSQLLQQNLISLRQSIQLDPVCTSAPPLNACARSYLSHTHTYTHLPNTPICQPQH